MTTATVTVMFTDLVDSTALMSRVGETAAEGLRREHFAVLRTAVDERGGREVKNLGDGLMVVFSSAADAVVAAVDIQRVLERRNRRAVEPLLVRVGIASGDADVEGDDFFGVPVVQASRLCARAAGGEVLCTDIVRALSGSRVSAVFEPVGELDLKGLSEPVSACRVTWTADADETVALPARLAVAVTDRFVGRSVEQERITTAWKRATSETQCRVVLLSGEPGIGKTTLTARLAAGVQAGGAVVVYGRCDEDLGIPYQPWIEALTQLLAAVSDEVVHDHVADRGAHLARLVPTVARRTGAEVSSGDGGDSERFVVLGCVVDLLERASADTPLLVVLDDLHWADRQSVQVLKHVATSAMRAPVMIVGTFRDTDIADGDPMSDLLAAFHRVDTVERIALRGLGDLDLLELLEHTAGHAMDDAGIALRDAVLAETDGNPFFVNEVLRHLAETGAIYRNDDGRWVGDDDIRAVGLPVSVTEVVGRRVAALGADTHQPLTVASVIGRDFDIATLAAATGVEELDVIDRCDAAVTAAVLQPTAVIDRYTFTHALIERTLYDSMSPSRRARAHRSVAEAIEGLVGPNGSSRVGELAHHWAAAVDPTHTAKALQYAELAAAASAELAPDEAATWYERALDLLERSPALGSERLRGVELLVGLGDAQRRSGDPEFRQTLLRAAHEADAINALDLQVRAVLLNNRGFWSDIGGSDDERIAAIERVLDRVGLSDGAQDADRSRLLALLAVEQYFRTPIEHREQLVEDAIEIARATGDPAVLGEVLYRSEVAVRSPTHLEQRRALMAEASALADTTAEPRVRFNIHANAALVAIEAADLTAIRRHRAICAEIVERTPHAQWKWEHTYNLVVDAILAGDLTKAEHLAGAALELGVQTGQENADLIFGTQLMGIRYHQGRLPEILGLVQATFDVMQSITGIQEALSLCHARSGQIAAAGPFFEQALADLPGRLNDNNAVFASAMLAETAVILGHRGAAPTLSEVLSRFDTHLVSGGVTVYPSVAHYLGRLDALMGRHEQAEARFAQAIAIADRMSSPLLAAHTHAAWAQVLADSNPHHRARARDLATDALDSATRLGLGDVAMDARNALDRLGPPAP